MEFSPKVTLYDRPASSIFSYLGTDENARTYSIGAVLGRVRAFADAFLSAVGVEYPAEDVLEVRLQHPGEDGGFTDIEVVGDGLHVIVEAKIGWDIPIDQLRKYAPRLVGSAGAKRLVALTACSQSYPRVATFPTRRMDCWLGFMQL